MSKPNMKCRICGKEYFCCSDSKKIGAWKSVSCSPECYKEYMKRIEESRKPQHISEKTESNTQRNKKLLQKDNVEKQAEKQTEKKVKRQTESQIERQIEKNNDSCIESISKN